MTTPKFDVAGLLASRSGDAFALHEQFVNPQFDKVLRVLGFDIRYVRGEGAYLYDDRGQRYIDCLAGFGVFGVGRNHPVVRDAIIDAMRADLPSLVKMGPYRVSGLLAEELCRIAPGDGQLQRVYFTNCGAAGVETAIKYARAATGRSRVLFCKRGYHGLTLGALSVNGGNEFRAGFGNLPGDATMLPFNDLPALDRELARGDVAGFIVEPIQGKGVNIPADDYLPQAAQLCRRRGALFIADEVQTGFGRTGRWFACQHWGVVPDIMVTSKALSGGYVPVGAVLTTKAIHDKVFSSLDRCMVHSNTFGQNDLAMVAGLATLHVMREEKLVENAAAVGEHLMAGLRQMVGRLEMVKDVRGRGLMVAVEFGPPRARSVMLRTGWELLHKVDAGLFPQAVLIPLLRDHHVLAQVAGHHQDVIKLIPPLVLTRADADAIVAGMDAAVAACHKFPGPAWEVGKRLASQAMKKEPAGA